MKENPKHPTSHLQKVKDFHDKDAEQYTRLRYHSESCEGLAYVTRRELVLSLLNHKPVKILDVGCGPGILTEDLLNRCMEVYSADLSIEMIKQAKQKADQNPLAKRAFFFVNDVSDMPLAAETIEIALCIGVMCYVSNYESVLSEIHRILKSGGEAIIQINKITWPFIYRAFVPLYRWLKTRLTSKNYDDINFEFNYFNYRKFMTRFKAAGFRVTCIEYYDFRIPFIDILLPALSVKIGRILYRSRHIRLARWLSHSVLVKGSKC